MTPEECVEVDALVDKLNAERALACEHVHRGARVEGEVVAPSALTIRVCRACFEGFAVAVVVDYLGRCRK